MDEKFNPWQIVSSEEKYNNKWINVTEHQVINPSGNPGIYGAVRFKNQAVGVIPLDEENNTWLVGQYRFMLNQYTWEIPEGGAPFGEDPVEGAARELEEETGLHAERYTKIVEMHLSNSVGDELATVYLAQGLSQHTAMPEDTEQLLVKKVPFEELYQQVIAGKITDSMTVAAALKIKIMIMEGKL
jgi:ADP-ribose pyrophosphatase YjhB (NUDIX family)